MSENSDVFPSASVAVAVIGNSVSASVNEKPPSPADSKSNKNVSPSPCPLGSGAAMNTSTTTSGGATPDTTTSLPTRCIKVNSGKFSNPFGPSSKSPGSFGVTPSPPKSIPRPALA